MFGCEFVVFLLVISFASFLLPTNQGKWAEVLLSFPAEAKQFLVQEGNFDGVEGGRQERAVCVCVCECIVALGFFVVDCCCWHL